MTDTTINEISATPVCVNRKEFMKILGCGQYTADKIARQSGARVEIGRLVLIYMPKVNQYLSDVTNLK